MSPSLHRIALSLAVVLACTVGGIDGAESRRAHAKAPAKGAQAATNTDRALDSAAKALDAGNADAAMSALDGILGGGGLSNPHMARALYLRGLAHRKKGRPAQAIADLTSAIWLKDGLNEKDRASALSARSEATREVGIVAPASSGGGAAPATQSAAAAAPPETAPPRARVAASSRPVASALSEAGFTRSTSPFSPSSAAPAPETAPARGAEPTPGTGAVTSSWESTTKIDAKGRELPSASRRQVSATPPASATPANPPASSGGGFGSFFTGLFSGGSSATTAPSNDAGGSSQWRPRTERAAVADTPSSPKAAEHKSARVARAAPSKDATKIATSAVPRGAYRLQIATVRSRKEANAVAAKVRGEYPGAIGNRQIEIDETVFGGMGTFYRVRLGPYANVSEPKVLCDRLRPKGYDCLVVTN
jgi:hypothetical protein